MQSANFAESVRNQDKRSYQREYTIFCKCPEVFFDVSLQQNGAKMPGQHHYADPANSLVGKRVRLEIFLHMRKEFLGVRAIHNAVVVGQSEIRHMADRDVIVAFG